MQVMNPRCAGLDLGKDIVVAAIRIQDVTGVMRDCRTYGMTSRELLELCSWLLSHGVTHVVMEATGSYWKSVWQLLEGQFELTLANAAHIRNLPGRKSDVNDATWMADLLAHGLVRGSLAGETNPERLADLAHPRLQVKRERLVEALYGRLTDQQRRLLGMHLSLVEALENSIAQLDQEIEKAVTPFREIVDRLKPAPGLSDTSVSALLGEIGVDMRRFKTHRHLVSWARLCPRLDESAGKVHSRRTQKGAAWIKSLMIQAAWAAVRNKRSYLHAQFLRLRARRGGKKAIVAVAASILTAVYYVIRDGTPYTDLGPDHFHRRDRTRTARRFVARLHQLGYNVQITEAIA